MQESHMITFGIFELAYWSLNI